MKSNTKFLNSFKAILSATITALTIINKIDCASKPAPTQTEITIAQIPFRSYRNIGSSETKDFMKKIEASSPIKMPEESWEDLIIRGRTKFEKNKDWHELVKKAFESLDKNDLQSRREFLKAIEELESKNYEAASELRDYLRTEKIIDIAK